MTSLNFETIDDIRTRINEVQWQLKDMCYVPRATCIQNRTDQLEIRILEIKLLNESLTALSSLMKVKLEFEKLQQVSFK